jgi:hypothetical protein
MTPQEQDMIGGLIDRVQKTNLADKDTDAEQMLQQGLGSNPDSLYILAQTVLVQKYALDQAQAQLSQAKAQMDQMHAQMQAHPDASREPRHATSFLGSLLGRNDQPAPPPPPPQDYPPQQSSAPYAATSGYSNVPQYGVPIGMGGGGFLQGALQTAAGVAAGALAFQGVESLMHGFGHAAGYGQELGGFSGGQGQRPEEIVNNYYGDNRGDKADSGDHTVSAEERALGAQEDRDLGSGNSTSSQDANDVSSLSDSKDNGDSLYANGDSNSTDDSSFDTDNSSVDDSSFDDNGSGGGDDSNFA